MLTRSHLMLAFAALSLPMTACIITTTTDDGIGGLGGFGGESSTTTSTSTSSSNSSSSTGDTSSSSSTGSGGCTDPAGTGKAEGACDSMANFPTTCPDASTPLAVPVCHKGFALYTAGSWEELQGCFESIPATIDDTCGTAAQTDVTDCINTMYADACANTNADTTCDDVNSACAQANDPNFNVDLCKQDLKPFSTSGLNAYVDCVNNSTDSCANLHDTCMTQVLSL